jgi:hypothetical protein
MKWIVQCRTLSWALAPLCGGRPLQGESDQGLQDKSADLGRAHVVGGVEVLCHIPIVPCWRFRANIEQNQTADRRRGSGSVGVPL